MHHEFESRLSNEQIINSLSLEIPSTNEQDNPLLALWKAGKLPALLLDLAESLGCGSENRKDQIFRHLTHNEIEDIAPLKIELSECNKHLAASDVLYQCVKALEALDESEDDEGIWEDEPIPAFTSDCSDLEDYELDGTGSDADIMRFIEFEQDCGRLDD